MYPWSDYLVQLVTNNYSILGCQGRCCSHDVGYRLGGPVAWMGMLIPFLDELVELGAKMICRFKIYHTSAFALQDTEPLFDLIHP
jgi:hypothetical protein